MFESSSEESDEEVPETFQTPVSHKSILQPEKIDPYKVVLQYERRSTRPNAGEDDS